MSTLPLAPLPASVEELDAAPFLVTANTPVTGEADAVSELRRILALRLPRGEATDEFTTPEISAATGRERPAAAGADRSSGVVNGHPGIHLSIASASPGRPASPHGQASTGGPSESYTLDARADGVRVTGADAAGLFYGVQTLAQLIAARGGARIVPAVRIADAPRFAYRGVMLDVARHFHGVDTVKAFIDRAASLKFNVLHLHLTDDQGWRLEIASRPLLAERASSSSVGGDPGGRFTQADYAEIVAYAASKHMTVVPEIDMPGHTHAVSLAYPELSEQPVLSDHIRETVRDHGGSLPQNGVAYDGMAVGFSSLRIHDEATYEFVADVLREVAELTPGPYLHIGGDEALGTPAEDFARFMTRVSGMVADLGKTPVAWHEAGAAPGLHSSTVGQYWGFVPPVDDAGERARAFVAHGSKVVLSPADAIYLDMKFDADSPLGLTWARGVTSAQRAYEWDAAAVVEGIGDDDILGVEAPLWTETVRDLADIDALAFPRIAAAAEAAWSPPLGTTPARTWDSFRLRVGGLAPLWSASGIGFTRLPEIAWADASTSPEREVRTA